MCRCATTMKNFRVSGFFPSPSYFNLMVVSFLSKLPLSVDIAFSSLFHPRSIWPFSPHPVRGWAVLVGIWRKATNPVRLLYGVVHAQPKYVLTKEPSTLLNKLTRCRSFGCTLGNKATLITKRGNRVMKVCNSQFGIVPHLISGSERSQTSFCG